jgi:hypothetical protein
LSTEIIQQYRKNAYQGDAEAQFHLGEAYHEGDDAPQNDALAVHWWIQAAERGCAAAQYQLGCAYSTGEGVLKDYVKAYMWFSLECDSASDVGPQILYNPAADQQMEYLQGFMTSEQIAAAKRLAQQWTRRPSFKKKDWMLAGFFQRWRDARAEAAAKHADLQLRFESFLLETEPFVPESKHRKAALYRHAWKRAAVLGIIYQERSDPALAAHFAELEKLAGERYFQVAPQTLYGKPPLQMGEKTGARLLEIERQRLFPCEEKQRIRPLACIYIGICEQGRVYVGQTVGAPESRWVQHRFGGTGPFKKGMQYVEWKVIEGGIDPAKLDERESYYIGLYNAYTKGYNETQGNDWRAYQRGQADQTTGTAR